MSNLKSLVIKLVEQGAYNQFVDREYKARLEESITKDNLLNIKIYIDDRVTFQVTGLLLENLLYEIVLDHLVQLGLDSRYKQHKELETSGTNNKT